MKKEKINSGAIMFIVIVIGMIIGITSHIIEVHNQKQQEKKIPEEQVRSHNQPQTLKTNKTCNRGKTGSAQASASN